MDFKIYSCYGYAERKKNAVTKTAEFPSWTSFRRLARGNTPSSSY